MLTLSGGVMEDPFRALTRYFIVDRQEVHNGHAPGCQCARSQPGWGEESCKNLHVDYDIRGLTTAEARIQKTMRIYGLTRAGAAKISEKALEIPANWREQWLADGCNWRCYMENDPDVKDQFYNRNGAGWSWNRCMVFAYWFQFGRGDVAGELVETTIDMRNTTIGSFVTVQAFHRRNTVMRRGKRARGCQCAGADRVQTHLGLDTMHPVEYDYERGIVIQQYQPEKTKSFQTKETLCHKGTCAANWHAHHDPQYPCKARVECFQRDRELSTGACNKITYFPAGWRTFSPAYKDQGNKPITQMRTQCYPAPRGGTQCRQEPYLVVTDTARDDRADLVTERDGTKTQPWEASYTKGMKYVPTDHDPIPIGPQDPLVVESGQPEYPSPGQVAMGHLSGAKDAGKDAAKDAATGGLASKSSKYVGAYEDVRSVVGRRTRATSSSEIALAEVNTLTDDPAEAAREVRKQLLAEPPLPQSPALTDGDTDGSDAFLALASEQHSMPERDLEPQLASIDVSEDQVEDDVGLAAVYTLLSSREWLSGRHLSESDTNAAPARRVLASATADTLRHLADAHEQELRLDAHAHTSGTRQPSLASLQTTNDMVGKTGWKVVFPRFRSVLAQCQSRSRIPQGGTSILTNILAVVRNASNRKSVSSVDR